MDSPFVLAPMRLEVLRLSKSQSVAEPSINPEQLPWSDGKRDFQADTAFLGSEIASPPFQNMNLVLKAGWHIHWQLPPELMRSRPDGSHPQLPNRWLVCRTMEGRKEHWMVESDYLHLPGVVDAGGKQGGTGTLLSRPALLNGPHFQKLGRCLSLVDWLGQGNQGEPQRLTAMVGGNPAFAAFYADCQGVFTFFDGEVSPDPEREVTYSVTGWYSRYEDDPVAQTEEHRGSPEELLRIFLAGEHGPQLLDTWRREIGRVERGEPIASETEVVEETPFSREMPEVPERLLCYGKVIHQPQPVVTRQTTQLLDSDMARRERLRTRRGATGEFGNPKVEAMVAIGHTATEALSAWLAERINAEAKTQLEAQLEAILMISDLDHRVQDQHGKFLEGRHQKGFAASHGGIRWVIRPESAQDMVAQAADTGKPGGPAIPDQCQPLLHQLNEVQSRLERLQDHELTLQHRVSADWHKVMLCAHPPAESPHQYPEPDAVAFLMRRDSAWPLTSVRLHIKTVTEEREVLRFRISGLLPRRLSEAAPQLVLKAEPGPRFWAPRDPVVVLEAPSELAHHLPSSIPDKPPAAVPGQTASHEPKLFHEAHRQFLPTPTWPLPTHLEGLTEPPWLPGHFTTHLRDHHDDPARPIFVEWAARLLPLVQRVTDDGPKDYDQGYLTTHYAPASASPDLLPRDAGRTAALGAQGGVDDRAISGRSLISAHAGRVLHDRLETYLLQHLDDAWLEPLPESEGPPFTPEARRRQWLEDPASVARALTPERITSGQGPSAGSLAHTALSAWQLIREKKILCLMLGGFNEALLSRRQMVQLPVADPIGFPEFQLLAEETRSAVGELSRSAPEPLFSFNPIRNGVLHLDRLRILDSFGRPYDVAFSKAEVIASEPLRLPGVTGVYFPPRFLQGMRVDFRWLSAAQAQAESNSHPSTSPVCGWLLPNRLDESLAIYDSEGRALGTIDVSGLWRSAPGDDHPPAPGDIANPHLRRLVLHLLRLSEDDRYQVAFLQTINQALEAIDPDSFAATPSLALLMGRPLAVVRASVKFQLRGEPEEDCSWPAMARRLAGERAHLTHGYEKVQIPFRIGEHHMLNDGVAGYWVEGEAGGFAGDLFYAPQTEAPRHPMIASYHEASLGADAPEQQDLVLKRSPVDPPLLLTMLLDPRGSAHLTCGVLPVKSIHLEESHFASALKNISVTFLAAPLLMAQDRTEVMLPGEPGYSWSYLSRSPQGWQEVLPEKITCPELEAVFHPGLTLREGWLRLNPVTAPTPPSAAPVTPTPSAP